MPVLCANGHENDPNNRFCEQCGARLDVAAPSSGTGGAGKTCPGCGAVVAHDEAFCDSCGAALPRGNEAVSSYDAPTVYAPTPPPGVDPADAGPDLVASASASAASSASAAPAPSSSGAACPVCGYQNMAGDRFCDQCGAALEAGGSVQAVSAGAAGGDATLIAPAKGLADPASAGSAPGGAGQQKGVKVACPACGTENNPANTFCENCGATLAEKAQLSPAPAGDAGRQPGAASPTPEARSSSPVAQEPAGSVPSPAEAAPVAAPAPSSSAGQPAGGESSAEERELEELVATERENLTMFEQMAARYKDRTPPAHVTAGLEEARRTLAAAEERLAKLREEQTAGPDPAEVARLEQLVATERENLTMFEQMAARYKDRTPPAHVTAGLEEARRTLADAEGQLAALTGGAPAQPAAPAASAPAAQTAAPEASAPASDAPAAPAVVPAEPMVSPAPEAAAAIELTAPALAGPAAPAAPEVTPSAAPAAAGAGQAGVLIVEGSNTRISLQRDKREFVIGREDPVSGIFPEVDLTPHGGESGGVSRQHAKLTHEDGRWMLTDLESTNYTKIDGARLQPHVATPVNSGAKLQFGRVVMIFQSE